MKKIIGMSSCLAGNLVRYDGQSEYRKMLYQQLQSQYQILTFCPEVAIGMPVPRPAIQLRQIQSSIHVVDKQTGKTDYTDALQQYAQLISKRYPTLQAYIFKQSSPSCGLGKTKIHCKDGEFTNSYTDGVFAKTLHKALPSLLTCCEDELITEKQIENFLETLRNV